MITFWTMDKIDGLRRLIAEGASGAQIAAQLGCSRCAVIGKARRLQLRLKGAPRNPAGGGRPKSAPRAPTAGDRVTVAAKARRMAVTAASQAAAGAARPAAVALPAAPVAFLAAVEAGTCLFFACDAFAPDGPSMPVCGGERASGSRYCAFHDRAKVDASAMARRAARRELRRLAA